MATYTRNASANKAGSIVDQVKVATEFLNLLKPDRPRVLTFIPPAGGATETVTLDTFDVELVAKRNGTRNCYFVVADLKDRVTRKPSKEQVASVSALWADLDGADKPALLARLSVDELKKVGLPPTSAIVDSGGGYHAYWKLSEPFVINGDPERWAEFERYLTFIRDALDGDPKVVDVSRIMRLPGTINHPGPDKTKRGRTACLSKVIRSSSVCYSIGSFRKGRRRDAMPTQATATALPADFKPQRGLDLETLLPGERFARLRSVLIHGEDPDTTEAWWRKDSGEWDRSRVLWWALCEVARLGGVSDETLALIQLDPDLPLSGHTYKQAKPVEYAQRQAARAKAEVEAAAQDFLKNDDGFPYKTPHNIRVAVRKLGVQLSYDEFADKNLIAGLAGFDDGPLQDEALRRMWLRTEEEFKFLPSRELFSDVVMDLARRNAFHPVRDFFDGLEWSGEKRIDTWLTTYLGADDTPFNRAVGAIVLMAAVRRVRQPGCKFDEVMVLEGKEGTGRSTALAVLATQDKWFTDNLSLQDDAKVIIENTAGKLIVEYGELEGIRKAEGEHVKRVLSRQVDEARLAYGRLVTVRPRQWIAIGTTNDDSYLKSFNGNRRFWPVKCGTINLAALRDDVDQLWAEAAHREAQVGASIRLPKEFWATARELQDERTVEPPNVDRLVEHLGWSRQGWIAPTDVYRLLGYKDRDPLPIERQGIGEALKKLGFERWKQRRGDASVWTWWRGSGTKHKALQIEVTLDESGYRYVVAQECAEARSPKMPLPPGGPASRRLS